MKAALGLLVLIALQGCLFDALYKCDAQPARGEHSVAVHVVDGNGVPMHPACVDAIGPHDVTGAAPYVRQPVDAQGLATLHLDTGSWSFFGRAPDPSDNQCERSTGGKDVERRNVTQDTSLTLALTGRTCA